MGKVKKVLRGILPNGLVLWYLSCKDKQVSEETIGAALPNHVHGIDQRHIERMIRTQPPCGTNTQVRSIPFVISLTSYPPRIPNLHLTLYSLLNQKIPADRVILWLGKEEFPLLEKNLPRKILQFKKFGLEIMFRRDIKQYKKQLYALREFPDSIICSADDDIYYQEDWTVCFFEEHSKYPDMMIAQRVHRILLDDKRILPYCEWEQEVKDPIPSFRIFPTGCSGILYPPDFYAGCLDALDEDKARAVCPHADDLWFWGMSVLMGKKIKRAEHASQDRYMTDIYREMDRTSNTSLSCYNVDRGGNDKQMEFLLSAYPKIREALLNG